VELALAMPENAGPGKTVQVSESMFGSAFNEPLVHQVVTAHQAAARSGTSAWKTRAEVSGGGQKPWRQKGTGRARAGTTRGPIWRGGGAAFAGAPQDFSQKVNKKMYRGAMRSIFSELVRQNRLRLVETFSLESPKTKALVSKLKAFGLKETMIVIDVIDENLYLAARNIPRVTVRYVDNVDPVSLIRYENVIMTVGAVRRLEEVLA